MDGATFAVERGELFSLLGPSGCGKTTLLRLVAGFEEPSHGTIRLDGASVAGVPPHRRSVHTVFQQYALFPHLSVFENVAFGPRSAGLGAAEIAARVRAALAVVRLGDLGDRRPASLSGGQQQRVALARALVNRPAAVLLDEPLAALDPELRRDMQGELARIQRESGVAFLLVTHDREEALALSDRLAVMHAGRIAQIGTPEAVYDAPESAFVARFIGAANLLGGIVAEIDPGAPAIAVRLANGGAARVAPPAGLGPPRRGDTVTLLVRPERVRLSASARDDGPGFWATLQSVVFQGATLRCTAIDGAGGAIEAHLPAAVAAPRPHPGERVWASWEAGAARLLDGDEAGAVASEACARG